MLAERFNVPPSQLENEEIALLDKGTIGASVLRALQRRRALLDSHEIERLTEGEWKLCKMADEAMKENGEG